MALVPDAVPWWMRTIWTLTPSRRSRSDSALIRSVSGRNVSPAVAPADTSSGVSWSSAPITPTFTPRTVKTTDFRTHDGRRPVAVSTMLTARNGKFARAWWARRRSTP